MNTKTLSFYVKLKRLEAQIKAALLAEYAYKDGVKALNILAERTRSALSRVQIAENLSSSIRNAILRDANFLIIRATYIVGIIVRSTSVRNPFEMYVPLLDICHALLGDDASLILSSEWQYIPFTHPQNLTELPQFVIIGMPASESDNVLVFPAAGHELGHSVWAKHSITDRVKGDVNREVDSIFLARKPEIETRFDVKGADFSQDMFVQYIKAPVYKSVIAQLEEFFSDFIGLLLFGESYLYAFEFLIAPQLGGTRSNEYPDTVFRATIMQKYAQDELHITLDDYPGNFLPDQPPKSLQSGLILDLADAVTSSMLPTVFAVAKKIIDDSRISTPQASNAADVEKAFKQGVPYNGEASLGDMVVAAWRLFRDDQGTHNGQGRRPDEYLADLVMKSVEVSELRKYM